MNQPRLKSKVFWAGVVSIGLIVMGNYGLYDIIGMPEGAVRIIIDTIFTMIGWGAVANNPTNKTGF